MSADMQILSLPPPTDLEEYTRLVEQTCKTLSKDCASRVVLHLESASATDSQADLTKALRQISYTGLQRWERALTLLQQQRQLIVAVLSGPVSDLALSLALACDMRLATTSAHLPLAEDGSAHESLPFWWLSSIALHAGALRAREFLWRRCAVSAAELLATGVVYEVSDAVSALQMTVSSLPLASNLPMQLLRRCMLQGFSIEGNDCIGHALAVDGGYLAR